jgi:hypothetical protein
MCFAVSINVLPWSLMFSSSYKCFAVADMGHRKYISNVPMLVHTIILILYPSIYIV